MNSRAKRTVWIVAGIFIVLIVGVIIVFLVSRNNAVNLDGGNIYYVNSDNGNDNNNGLSERRAFQSLDMINEITLLPGDQVLLHKDSVFDDQYLHIQGSGTEEAPIIISTYGEGDSRPVINANGQGLWDQDYGIGLDRPEHKAVGTVSSAILLNDVEYIEIRGLEITNEGADGNKAYNDLDVMSRTGVAVWAQNAGVMNHIYLDDLYVHDVIGNVYDKNLANGGIFFAIGMPEDEDTTGIPKFNDIRIINNHVEDSNRWGISFGYTAYWYEWAGAEYTDELYHEFGSTNVLIEGNFLKNIGGDAITPMYTLSPVVQYNISDAAAKQINFTDYSETAFQRASAAMWPWKCKDALFQYNEAYHTLGGKNGNADAQAWDADHGYGTVYQYNYSYGNTGGTVMFCDFGAYNSTFRYNLSVNDEWGLISVINNPDSHVHNNVFLVKDGVSIIRDNMANGASTLENNIFYYTGDTPREETWIIANKIFDNNIYYNYSDTGRDENGILLEDGSELFINIEDFPSETDGEFHMHEDPEASSIFDGFKVLEDSAAVDSGKEIENLSEWEMELDFFRKCS